MDWNQPILDTIPVVAQLTDDDGDGDIDQDDSPDVVYLSTRNGGGELGNLYVVDGETGSEHWRVTGLFGRIWSGTLGAACLAVGDLDGDGVAEIVVPNATEFLVFEHDGTEKARIPVPVPLRTRGHALSLADLNQDGVAEIVTQSTVASWDGSWGWQGTAGGSGGDEMAWSLVADIRSDLPGLELFAGNTLYDSAGSVVWQAAVAEGSATLGDVDGDGSVEIVLLASRSVYLLDLQGALLGEPFPFGGRPVEMLSVPLLAQLDEDPEPELVVAANSYLVALEWSGTLWRELWRETVNDPYGAGGVTAFDLDGDGIDELIHRDWDGWSIRDGRCGSLLHQEPFPSLTGLDQPVVANIDRDPQPEVLINSGVPWDYPTAFLIAYELPGACEARSIWNQATYHVTNVGDDASIPQFETPPWAISAAHYSQAPAREPGVVTGLRPANAELGGPCAGSVSLQWQPAVLPDGLPALVDIWRIDGEDASGCCDTSSGSLIAEGLSVTSFIDSGASFGDSVRYLLRAGAPDGAACASLTECTVTISLTDPLLLPAPPGPALRLSSTGGNVTLSWPSARPLAPDEHFHLTRATATPTAPFLPLGPEASQALSYLDTEASAPLLFYDLRISDPCENESTR